MKRRVIGIIFIVIGLVVIGTALFMRYSAERVQKAMIDNFEHTIEDIDKNGVDNGSSAAKPPTEDINAAIGIMKIPKIDLKVAIGEGIDNKTLKQICQLYNTLTVIFCLGMIFSLCEIVIGRKMDAPVHTFLIYITEFHNVL